MPVPKLLPSERLVEIDGFLHSNPTIKDISRVIAMLTDTAHHVAAERDEARAEVIQLREDFCLDLMDLGKKLDELFKQFPDRDGSAYRPWVLVAIDMYVTKYMPPTTEQTDA